MPVRQPVLCRGLLLGLVLLGGTVLAGAAPLEFFACGDLPYAEAEWASFERLLADGAQRRPSFIVHVGDVKSGSAPCDTATYERVASLFHRQPVPVVYTPGDNEWTDCRRSAAGGYEPTERLAVLRQHFFADPSVLRLAALGAVRPIEGYPELYWFMQDQVLFSVIHVVGSHDNAAAPAEQEARAAANQALLGRALAAARRNQARALVVVFHADPAFERPGALHGYEAFFADLDELRRDFQGPILAIHGDTHRYRFDQPLKDPATGRPDPRFTRLEVPGSPSVGGVWVTIDPEATPVFAAEPVYPVSRVGLMPEG